MQTPIEILLDKIVRNPLLHARWLNTFSFLEYVGFRKIVKSQIAESLTAETLQHALEEGRHAMMLKKMAIRLGGSTFDSYSESTLLCGEQAEDYFQNLDHEIELRLKHSRLLQNESFANTVARLTYLYVTWLVEVRALKVYAAYEASLKSVEQEFPLSTLIAEEAHHLTSVEEELQQRDPGFAERAKEFQTIESELYEGYLRSLIEAVEAVTTSSFYQKTGYENHV